ncbi:MAG: Rrf2 family protein [Cognaticolwellia sp.]|jgi:Rrf2 family protein
MLTRNTHFSIGVHVLTALAVNRDTPMTSATLASSVDTNPAFLRQVIGQLRKAGLVQTKLGKGGGSLLDREPQDISLLDVYRATVGTAGLATHDCPPDSHCFVAQGVPQVLDRLSARLDAAVAAELSGTNIAQVADEVRV